MFFSYTDSQKSQSAAKYFNSFAYPPMRKYIAILIGIIAENNAEDVKTSGLYDGDITYEDFFENDQDRPSATLVISGDIFKIYFDENVDLILIKENLQKRQTKYQDELDKISQRLSNKGFVERAPKNIVEKEKTNYSNLKNDIKKISLTIESL